MTILAKTVRVQRRKMGVLQDMGTVSSRYLLSYYNSCIAKGCPKEPLLELIGEGDAPFDNPARRFDNEVVLDMLDLASSITGDARMGLYAGADFRPSTFLDIGLALVSCPTLRAALKFNEKYQSLTQQLGKTRLEDVGGKGWLTWRPYIDDAERMRPVTEAVFAGYAVFGRWLTWIYDRKIDAMKFRHAKPGYDEYCQDLFDCPVTYDEPMDVMVLDDEVVDTPLPQANPELLTVLSARLDRALGEQRAPLTARTETFHCIQAMLSEGPPKLPRVAAAQGVSERTLRRRLSEEGVSYRQVLEEARREVCEVYIRERKKSIAEIAQSLGYSEQSAFTRAFKNWFGQPPSAYIQAG